MSTIIVIVLLLFAPRSFVTIGRRSRQSLLFCFDDWNIFAFLSLMWYTISVSVYIFWFDDFCEFFFDSFLWSINVNRFTEMSGWFSQCRRWIITIFFTMKFADSIVAVDLFVPYDKESARLFCWKEIVTENGTRKQHHHLMGVKLIFFNGKRHLF